MDTLKQFANLGKQLEEVAKKQKELINECQESCKKAMALFRSNWEELSYKEVRDSLGYEIGNMESFMDQFDEGVDMQVSGDYPNDYQVRFTVESDISDELGEFRYNVKGNYGEFVGFNNIN